MGLLDSLLSGDNNGGLLSFLQSLQPHQQGQAGPLSPDLAQPYGNGPMSYGAQPQAPVFQNPLQANAQQPVNPQQQPMPPQQPPPVIQAQPPSQGQPPSALDRFLAPQPPAGGLGAGLSGFVNNLHTGPIGALIGGIGSGLGMQDPKTQVAAQQANLTAQALKSKGIPDDAIAAAVGNGRIPGNTELLKTLIARAYPTEEKIPFGWTKDDSGAHFVPNGPADPAYLRLKAAQEKDPNAVHVLGKDGELYKVDDKGNPTIVHKNESSTGLSDDALDIHARQEAQGDFSGRKNMGHGAQTGKAIEQIQNRTADILTNEYHMTPAEAAAYMSKKYQDFNAQGIGLNAEARTSGVREGNLNLILKAADAAIPAALDASDKVNRTNFVPLNKVIQAGQVATSDPDLKKYAMANLQLAEHWARAMNPTGVMRESDRDMALSILGTADSKQTYKAAVQQLRTQIVRERDAVRSTRGMATLPGVAAPSSPADPLGIR